ncbi:SDR family NAD(P)-dependent oxidoreductase [Actinacidiphila sp. ITFR-21]|uniref:SDR family NAD(P)-dependent oxidoreductase n=1 Tax=Actinacidiphila sp. ITFR-21 TaxID=3075199 RepID=UPI00288954B5|nr:SDR family NAD(P)-dependent oxidoreductase [Streptomyces sp. ITFR-21]WNI19032.1 SDR family NAD(P)-dependent oxidoreductase [Streptomyces sp. ITFR-21]
MSSPTTKQHSIGSGFGARSTAADVLAGVDLTGRLVLLTGGYSGIGLETTRALTAAGARVVVPARRPETARQALAGIDRVEVDELDLADQDSIAAFADRFLATGRDIDVTINCAAVMAAPYATVGPGWESQFGINHLGHYALVNRLWPAIARGRGRVVAVSSGGHRRSPVRWDDIDFAGGYDKWAAYGQAKTANALFARHLDTLAEGFGVRAFSVHPGGILTPLQRHLSRQEMVDLGWIDADGNLLNAGFKSPEQGAATQVWAATSPRLAGLGGVYCEDCDIAEPIADSDTTTMSGVRSWATDPEQAARLWALSAERTGLDAFAS